MPSINEATYVDVNSRFGLNRRPEIILDNETIENSFYNIITTPLGTRQFRRDYGSKLHEFIHEPIDAFTAFEIEADLLQNLRLHEQRARIIRSRTTVSVLKPPGIGFLIQIGYVIKITEAFYTFRVKVERKGTTL